MLVNDECSHWYNSVGDFLLSVLDRKKETSYGNGQVCEVSQINPTRECYGGAMSALWGLSMSDLFIYLLTKLMSIRIYVL